MDEAQDTGISLHERGKCEIVFIAAGSRMWDRIFEATLHN